MNSPRLVRGFLSLGRSPTDAGRASIYRARMRTGSARKWHLDLMSRRDTRPQETEDSEEELPSNVVDTVTSWRWYVVAENFERKPFATFGQLAMALSDRAAPL